MHAAAVGHTRASLDVHAQLQGVEGDGNVVLADLLHVAQPCNVCQLTACLDSMQSSHGSALWTCLRTGGMCERMRPDMHTWVSVCRGKMFSPGSSVRDTQNHLLVNHGVIESCKRVEGR